MELIMTLQLKTRFTCILAVPSLTTVTIMHIPVTCHVGTDSMILGSTTLFTDLTAGTAHGMLLGTDGMAAGMGGMTHGITAMPAGTVRIIMATMVGAGLIAMAGMAGTHLTGVAP